jgi:hypothetical protein
VGGAIQAVTPADKTMMAASTKPLLGQQTHF